ncbi:hypothetical protein GBAR_LOCUS21269 [Geodia barretti]|jgi:hypothetical protein
MLRL